MGTINRRYDMLKYTTQEEYDTFWAVLFIAILFALVT